MMETVNSTKDRAKYAALWRWAKTLCNGPCKVKGKHVRGYEYCEKNPDRFTFGFTKRMG